MYYFNFVIYTDEDETDDSEEEDQEGEEKPKKKKKKLKEEEVKTLIYNNLTLSICPSVSDSHYPSLLFFIIICSYAFMFLLFLKLPYPFL